jgi:hypothetical protein
VAARGSRCRNRRDHVLRRRIVAADEHRAPSIYRHTAAIQSTAPATTSPPARVQCALCDGTGKRPLTLANDGGIWLARCAICFGTGSLNRFDG